MKLLVLIVPLLLQGCDMRNVLMGVKYEGPFPGLNVLRRKYNKQTTELFKKVMGNVELQDILDDTLKSRDKAKEAEILKGHEAAQPGESLEAERSKYIPVLHLQRFVNSDSKRKIILTDSEMQGLRSLMLIKRTRIADKHAFAQQFKKLFLTVESGLPKVCELDNMAFGSATPEIKAEIGCNAIAGTIK